MWYLKAFVLLVVIVAVLLFALANSSQQVVIRWLSPDTVGTPVNLAFALLTAYFLGILTFFFASAVREIRWRARCAHLERDLGKMRGELNALRTAALDGPLGGAGEPPSEGSAEAEEETL